MASIMQGTACVGLAGILGAVRAMGRPVADLANLKFVIVGAGRSALQLCIHEELPSVDGSAIPITRPLINLPVFGAQSLVT